MSFIGQAEYPYLIVKEDRTCNKTNEKYNKDQEEFKNLSEITDIKRRLLRKEDFSYT